MVFKRESNALQYMYTRQGLISIFILGVAMKIEINAHTLSQIKNSTFQKYAQIYITIYEHFLQQVAENAIEMDKDLTFEQSAKYQRLLSKGGISRNNGKSIYCNWLSPACEACRKGEASITLYLSLMCHRHCYYCFNPNQESYEYYSKNKRDCIEELKSLRQRGQKLNYIALTGGEPLLHKKDTIDFFRFARENFRHAYTRLYTSGDLLDQQTLEELSRTQLNEIRFSIKLEDSLELRNEIYSNIALAKQYIPHVMAEMPVIPGTFSEMKQLLITLADMKIDGINLLEFCFPFHNVQEFQKRSFMMKNPPYKVLYNYWYAGGLPVSRSELECLDLVEFALDTNLQIGIHYCSLENKYSGQVFQQNNIKNKFSLTYLSPQDFFLKTAKVFGEDIPAVLELFKKKKQSRYQINKEHEFLEFPVQEIHVLKSLDLEIAISSNIIEIREGESYLRELKIERVHAKTFDMHML